MAPKLKIVEHPSDTIGVHSGSSMDDTTNEVENVIKFPLLEEFQELGRQLEAAVDISSEQLERAIDLTHRQIFYTIPEVSFDHHDEIMPLLAHILSCIGEKATAEGLQKMRGEILDLITTEGNEEAYDFLISHLPVLDVTQGEMEELQKLYPDRSRVPGYSIGKILNEMNGIGTEKDDDHSKYVVTDEEKRHEEELLDFWRKML